MHIYNYEKFNIFILFSFLFLFPSPSNSRPTMSAVKCKSNYPGTIYLSKLNFSSFEIQIYICRQLKMAAKGIDGLTGLITPLNAKIKIAV